ncbi:peptidoglycan DD-metalloendopeptidase family protein [Hahella sp. SMD15-11]|uniref:Peptidoglycan DD-metalloendopeptidase family protein n=1 Tax=Thermohahella caldifontis TaxID=3142973 RepID=A0AB39UW00_9GAMM
MPARILILLLGLLLISGTPARGAGWEDNTEDQARLESIRKQLANLQGWMGQARARQSRLERELADLERDIQALTRTARQLAEETEAIEKELDDLRNREQALSRDLDVQTRQLGKALREQWKLGQQPALKLMLSGNSPADIDRMLTYLRKTGEARQALIRRTRALMEEIRKVRADILGRNQALLERKAAAEKNRARLAERKAERTRLLAALQKDISGKAGQISKLERDQKELESLVQEVEKSLTELDRSPDARPFAQLRRKLPWPLEGEIVRRFGEQFQSGARSTGMVIAARPEAPVRAIHHGRVIFADWLRGFGLLMILDHGDGYMSLYGYNQALLRSPGNGSAVVT